MASYAVDTRAVARARRLIAALQYVLDSDRGEVQPGAKDETAYLRSHTWEDYAEWHLGLTEGARDGTKARHALFGPSRCHEPAVREVGQGRRYDGQVPASMVRIRLAGLSQ